MEFNDPRALEAALAHGDVACVLAEPALTNIGIVLPEPGFHDAMRDLTRAAGTLLVIDETHTMSAGPGGFTAAENLEPDLLTVGKALAGGVPAGAFGMSAQLATRVGADPEADYEDVGGVGGTLAGNALSLAAMRGTLEHVLTPAAFEGMFRARAPVHRRRARGAGPARRAVAHRAPRRAGRVRVLGAAPRNGGEAAAIADEQLEEYMHLFCLNRGVLITPFHNMALMSPATTEAHVDRHTEVFGAALEELFS